MCRLGIYGGVNEFRPLARALNQLEKSMGGDGNGLWSTEFEDELIKGINVTTAEIAFDTFGAPGAHVFHTRFATAGGVKSNLNHPFDAGDWVVAHNGHWHDWVDYAEGNEMSDTQTAARLVKEHGPGVLLNSEFGHSGIWVVARADLIFVISQGSRGFKFQFLKGGGFFHASEAIKGLPVVKSINAKANRVYTVDANTGEVAETAIPTEPMPAPVFDSYAYAKDENGETEQERDIRIAWELWEADEEAAVDEALTYNEDYFEDEDEDEGEDFGEFLKGVKTTSFGAE